MDLQANNRVLRPATTSLSAQEQVASRFGARLHEFFQTCPQGAYSGASWPGIPIEVGHRFRREVGHVFRSEVGHLFRDSGISGQDGSGMNGQDAGTDLGV